ncbi:hypothetical protein LJC30_01365 [Odoribacter sp. OttesenSCG-928-L07]|nr:hypothetical protein [Odoribacter sp. OttesenSCG-928-L07]MDL2239927.1 hypothetical protein [Bacteroidales bacterium OttesenSCG-928-L14]MDL2240771.1 hypothetical protein [Bacteroidales bacterium OttesenSCG-928-K22]
MNKKFWLVIVIFTLSYFGVYAQENNKTKFDYSNITEMSFAVNPLRPYLSCEFVSVHGVSINKNHVIGLGGGIGGNCLDNEGVLCPLFLNYRYRFNVDQKLSPHINIALGTVLYDGGEGLYSSLIGGFSVGVFSFSGGFFFYAYEVGGSKVYPFGVNFRIGFDF